MKRKDEAGRELKRSSFVSRDHDDSNVRWVQREFELRAQGLLFQAIRDQVISEGLVPRAKLSQYRANTVEKRITNSFYWGRFEWKGEQFQGNHELIIPGKILSAFIPPLRASMQKKSLFGISLSRSLEASNSLAHMLTRSSKHSVLHTNSPRLLRGGRSKPTEPR